MSLLVVGKVEQWRTKFFSEKGSLGLLGSEDTTEFLII